MRILYKILWVTAVLMMGLILVSEASSTRKPVEIPVLGYHHLIKDGVPPNGSTITVTKFEKDMIALKKSGYIAILFKDLYNYTHGRLHLPEKPILITFDDGYKSNYDLAWPVLKKMDMRATIFMIGWCVGNEAKPLPFKPHYDHFTWNQAKEMADSGVVEIESHTFDLHDVGRVSSGERRPCGYGAARMKFESDSAYVERITRDFSHSYELHKKYMKHQPLALSYPFGRYDDTTEMVSKSLFMGTITVKPGVRFYSKPEDLYEIPRILIHEETDVIKAIENWELQPWEPFLTDMEADIIALPDLIHLQIQKYNQSKKMRDHSAKKLKNQQNPR